MYVANENNLLIHQVMAYFAVFVINSQIIAAPQIKPCFDGVEHILNIIIFSYNF